MVTNKATQLQGLGKSQLGIHKGRETINIHWNGHIFLNAQDNLNVLGDLRNFNITGAVIHSLMHQYY